MLRRFIRCSSGSVAVSTAVLLVLLIGLTGLGVEVASWYQTRRSMQGAADAAAVGANWALKSGGTCDSGIPCSWPAGLRGLAVASENGWTHTLANKVQVEVVSPPTKDGSPLKGDPEAVEVWITQPQHVLFGAVDKIPSPTVGAYAISKFQTKVFGPSNCVLALANAANAIQVRGLGDLVANCGISVDGGRDQNAGGTPLGGIQFQGANSAVHVSSLTVAAASTSCPDATGANQDHCYEWPVTNMTALPAADVFTNAATSDPYASRTFQLPSGVTSCVPWSGTPVPGTVYCSINVAGNGTVTFPSGIYYIAGGDANCVGFCTQGAKGTVQSAAGGVTFVLTKGFGTGAYGAETYARVDVTSGNLNLAAPVTDINANGTSCSSPCANQTHGLIFFQDRNATTTTSLDSASNPWPYGVTAASVTAGGNGYTNGTQTFTVIGGTTAGGTTNNAATFTATVTNGAVTAVVAITNPGAYTTLPTNPVSATGGGGTGAAFNLTTGPITQNTFAGNGTRNLSGVLYFPQQTLSLQGNGPVTGTCVEAVAKYIDVGGTPSFANGCAPGSGVDPITSTITQAILSE